MNEIKKRQQNQYSFTHIMFSETTKIFTFTQLCMQLCQKMRETSTNRGTRLIKWTSISNSPS